ncbi:Isthmin-2 [Manis pentadactyla]|nr:Isthmin-2 [Manis pentadactyla]
MRRPRRCVTRRSGPRDLQELTATLNRNCLWGVASGRGSSAVLVWHCCAEMGPQIALAGTLAKVHGVFQPQASPDLRANNSSPFGDPVIRKEAPF